MAELAPVALFVYNRLNHTRKTISALQENALAEKTHLFIFSDGSKSHLDKKQVGSVRRYIKQITGFKSITVVERNSNFGLADSIVDGVTGVVNKYGKVIVLEDDLVTSPSFLTFMNESLCRYQTAEKVMNINGYVLPTAQFESDEAFFIRLPSPWGWATWVDRWQFFSRDVDSIMTEFSISDKSAFDFDTSHPFFRTIVRNKKGALKTWAIFWYATIFKSHGLCLSPGQTLVQNIGHDGSGSNCGKTEIYNSESISAVRLSFPDKIVENKEAYEAYKDFYQKHHANIATAIYLGLLKVWRGILLRKC